MTATDSYIDHLSLSLFSQSKPPLPSYPKYEGLGFVTGQLSLPFPATADIAFPPAEGADGKIALGPMPVPGVPSFSVETGLVTAA